MSTFFDQWEAGDLTDQEALRALALDLGELEDELGPLERDRKALRGQIERITLHAGGRAEVPGFGELVITQPAQIASYDARALDALVADLVANYPEIATRIAAAPKETSRAGSLRITRAK